MTVQRFIRQEKWAHLTDEEKLTFFLDGDLPTEKLDGLERFLNSNFHIDWEVLRPAIEHAIHEIRSGKHTTAAWGTKKGEGWISGDPISSVREGNKSLATVVKRYHENWRCRVLRLC